MCSKDHLITAVIALIAGYLVGASVERQNCLQHETELVQQDYCGNWDPRCADE